MRNDQGLMEAFPFVVVRRGITPCLEPEFSIANKLSAGEDPLEMSIAKLLWLRANIRWSHEYINDNGVITCALCLVHDPWTGCGACPVKKFTGQSDCNETPYKDYAKAEDASVKRILQIMDEWIEFAKEVQNGQD